MPPARPAPRVTRTADERTPSPGALAAPLPAVSVGHLVGRAGAAPLRAGEVLHLQRTLGNRAVGRLLQAPAGVQRAKRFGGLADAEAYVRENSKDRVKDTTADKYYNRLKGLLKKTVDEEDLGWLRTASAAAWSLVERKTLSPDGWKHIWRGDRGSGGHPTGFHWKGKADEAFCEGFGATEDKGNGFYSQSVQFKGTAMAEVKKLGKVTKTVKPDASTFFPDAWSEQEVKDAVELRNSSDEITKPVAGYGVKLNKSGDTIYPYFP